MTTTSFPCSYSRCGEYLPRTYRDRGLTMHPSCAVSADLDRRYAAKVAARTAPLPSVEEMRVKLRESMRNRSRVFI
jgi:hypothetical protein